MFSSLDLKIWANKYADVVNVTDCSPLRHCVAATVCSSSLRIRFGLSDIHLTCNMSVNLICQIYQCLVMRLLLNELIASTLDTPASKMLKAEFPSVSVTCDMF